MKTDSKSMNDKSAPGPVIKPTTINHNVYGVFPSLALLAAMELDVFTPLRDGPLEAKALARALGVEEEKITPLLYLLVVAGVLETENDTFANTPEAAEFLVRGRPGYMGESGGFYKMLWTLGLKTAESIRSGQPQAKLDFHNLPDEELLSYFQKQIHHSISAGKEIAEKFDFSGFTSLLDAGGGSGGVSIAVCRKYPHLKATVADLPKVVNLAKHFIDEAGLSHRISLAAADLCADSPAGAYDVAILRAVIQTLSRDEAQAVIKNVGRCMTPGGRLYIFGNVLENSRLGPPISLAYSLVFLNSYDHGRAYTEQEYHDMLKADFKNITVDYEALDGLAVVSAERKR